MPAIPCRPLPQERLYVAPLVKITFDPTVLNAFVSLPSPQSQVILDTISGWCGVQTGKAPPSVRLFSAISSGGGSSTSFVAAAFAPLQDVGLDVAYPNTEKWVLPPTPIKAVLEATDLPGQIEGTFSSYPPAGAHCYFTVVGHYN